MKKICFIGRTSLRFIDIDREILAEEYELSVHRKKDNILSHTREIKQAVRNSDMVYGFFASWETLPGVYYANRYDKPSVIVTGGYDVAYEPDIDYGTSFKENFAAKQTLNRCSVILPFSRNAAQETTYWVNRNNIVTVPFGISSKGFKYSDDKQDLVITVGEVKKGNLKRKGLQFLAEASNKFPDIPFVLAGRHSDDETVSFLQSIGGDNLELSGFISDERLKELYQRAKVYVQASGHEGFGMAMAEAMLSGCHPVVSRRGAIPEVVGNTGIYVDYGDRYSLYKGIQQALQQNGGCRAASNRIRQQFPLDKRKERLLSAVDEVIS